MKLIIYTLIVILFAANVAPCFDVNDKSTDDEFTQISSFDDTQHQTSQDACSPFCTCSCCVASVDVVSFGYTLNNPSVITQDLSVFDQLLIENSGISFWQPPQFS